MSVYPIWSSRRIINITLNPTENFIAPPQALPLIEPVPPQVVWTIGAGDLPTIIAGIFGYTPTGQLTMCGNNNDVSARTIFWRMYLGAVPIANGNFNCPAGRVWNVSGMWFNPVVGNVLSLAVWASGLNCDYDYDSEVVTPDRIFCEDPKIIYHNIEFTVDLVRNTLVGILGDLGTGRWFVIHKDHNFVPSSNTFYYRGGATGQAVFDVLKADPTYGLWYNRYGDLDIQNSALGDDALQRRNAEIFYPTTITYRFMRRWMYP